MPLESIQGEGSAVVASLAIVVTGALLAFRRSHPLVLIGIPALWIVIGFAAHGEILVLFFGQAVPLYLVIFTGARHCPLRHALAVCGSVVVAVVLADLFISEMQGLSEQLFHWGAMLAVLGTALGLRASERRAVSAGRRAAEAEAAAREAALRAAAEERARIARELHDILGHSVSVMVVQAGAAAQAVDDDPAFVREALETIRRTGSQSLDEVRRVVTLLRAAAPDGLDPQPGLADVPALIDDARAQGTRVDLVETGERPRLSPGQELAVYRILQESLTNIRKHASDSPARVELTSSSEGVDILVDSRSAGVRATSGTKHGLVGMRERVQLYGGTLEAGPTGDGGWRVHARMPAEVRV